MTPETAQGPGIGDPAPSFDLPNQYGERVSLDGFAGRPVVLVFYPFAFSRVCSGELSSLAEQQPAFAEAGAALLAVSCDAKYALRAWAMAQGWSFDLLSDFWPHGDVARRYGVLDEGRGLATRSSFFIGPDKTIRHILRSSMNAPRNPDEYLRALEGMTAAGRA
ncbi:peroxiredoxin [Arthrobacter sp. Sa2BUA2]|uniref:Peroxiredoxin n=1 Tax=Arthrobacter pullicola TaxID=2762224 RepID=A0ABR8YM11_9MICC|nr:peroxiredoxin [Arthrobacter pullicola]MBD8045300.1 peroxiredoxin [Arthrobacter pullicola]